MLLEPPARRKYGCLGMLNASLDAALCCQMLYFIVEKKNRFIGTEYRGRVC